VYSPVSRRSGGLFQKTLPELYCARRQEASRKLTTLFYCPQAIDDHAPHATTSPPVHGRPRTLCRTQEPLHGARFLPLQARHGCESGTCEPTQALPGTLPIPSPARFRPAPEDAQEMPRKSPRFLSPPRARVSPPPHRPWLVQLALCRSAEASGPEVDSSSSTQIAMMAVPPRPAVRRTP
jgi:hypothetical protein